MKVLRCFSAFARSFFMVELGKGRHVPELGPKGARADRRARLGDSTSERASWHTDHWVGSVRAGYIPLGDNFFALVGIHGEPLSIGETSDQGIGRNQFAPDGALPRRATFL